MTTTSKEQWEALVLEPEYWKRQREIPKGTPKLDSIDESSIEDKFIREGVGKIDRLETPLARFVKLMYTDQFSEFRDRVLEDVSGISSMSDGVRDMIIDQTFRYFVLVDADPIRAVWFAQVVVSIAVFRVKFDEGVINKLKNVIRETKQHFFKKSVSIAPPRGVLTDIPYTEFRNISYPSFMVDMLSNPGEVTHFRKHMIRMDDIERDLRVEHVNLIQPTQVHAVSGDSERELYLHILQLITMYNSPDSRLIIYYYSKKAQKYQDVLKRFEDLYVNHEGPVNASKADVFIMISDDGVNIDEFNFMRENLGGKLAAYSFKVGLESKNMNIPGGRVINTPWKPVHESWCRMVWEPTDVISMPVERTYVKSHIIIQDMFMRPFARYDTRSQNSRFWNMKHLLRGEFDSELEVFILESLNVNEIPEFLDGDRLIVPPRSVLFHPEFKPGMLERFVEFILRRHLSSIRNYLYALASRCSRLGVYPPTDKTSEHTKAIQTIFGKTLQDGIDLFGEYMKLEGSRIGIVETIREKDIFPMIEVKKNIMPDIISLFDDDSDKLMSMVSLEPFSDERLSEDVIDTFFRLRGKMDLVVLGESLGNAIHQFIAQYSFREREIGEVIGEMGPRMESMWKYVGGRIPYRSARNIVEVLNRIEETRTPFTILVTGSYPKNILTPFINKYISTERLVGVYNITERDWTPGDLYYPAMSRDTFAEEVFRISDMVRSCMILGNGIGLSKILGTNITTLSIVHTDMTESKTVSGAVGSLRLAGIDAEIFIENLIDSRFVSPTPGMVYDMAIISPMLTNGLSGTDLKKLIDRVREEVLTYTGEIKILLSNTHIVELEKMLPYREMIVSHHTLYEMKDSRDAQGEFDDNYIVSIQREIPSAVERYQGKDLNTGEQVRAYNNYVKNTLISEFIDMFVSKTKGSKPSVLDLACGKGQDIFKWKNSRFYLGIDGSSMEIDEAKRRYKNIRGLKPKMKFVVDDVFGSGSWAGRLSEKYDVVSCQLAIHYAFGTERSIKGLLHNISQLLNNNGSFLVSTLDSGKIINKIKAAQITGNDLRVSRGRYYAIETGINTLRKIDDRITTGADYVFTQFPDSDNPRTTTEFLVDSEYFRSLCKEQGMEIVTKKNFLEYFGNGFGKDLDQDELELIELYCTYEIVKTRPPEPTPVRYIPTIKKEFYDLTEKLLEPTPLIRNSDVLFIGPEHIKPSSSIAEQAKSSLMITEDIDFLRIPPGNTTMKIILENKLTESTSYLKSSYDVIYLPGTVLSDMSDDTIQNILSTLKVSGVVQGVFVRSRAAYHGKKVYLIQDSPDTFILNGEKHRYLDITRLRDVVGKLNASIEISDIKSSDPDLNLFSRFYIRIKVPGEAAVNTDDAEPSINVESKVDKFVLSSDQKKQKNPPGDLKLNESLAMGSSKDKYDDLKKYGNWRQMLSDTWEGPEFSLNESESFKSVEHAIMHFKGRVKGVEGYQAFNAMNTNNDISLPEGKTDREAFIKPFRAAAMTTKADKKALEEYKRIVYEAKFRNGVYGDVLMATKDSHLYTTAAVRNELLEEVRNTIKAVISK